jgi:hypothetical protein
MTARPGSLPRLNALCLLLFLLGLANAWAAGPARKLELRFAAQDVPGGLGSLVMVSGDARSDPFNLPVNFLSDPQVAPARVFRLEQADNPRVLASITLPEDGQAFIILLVPGTESVFEPVVIPARGNSFRPGDYYLHNTSRLPVLGQVGSVKFVIPPRTGRVVRPKGAREERFYDVILGVREKKEDRVISTSRWPLAPQMRTYVFFFDNPKRGDVDFRAIDEFVPPENPE